MKEKVDSNAVVARQETPGEAPQAGPGPRLGKPVKKLVRKRAKRDPVKAWKQRLDRYRPGLVDFTLDGLRTMYGKPEWQPAYDPTSELILTMLSANSADINAEKAFDALCRHWPPQTNAVRAGAHAGYRPGWGGVGIQEIGADWVGHRRRAV